VLPGPPPDLVPAGAEVSALFPDGDHLGMDGSGALTAVFHQDLRLASGQTTAHYDLVISDRPAGGAWSPMPHVADDGYIGNTDLAVNPSGTAVVAWDEFDDRTSRAYVSYRPTADAAWTPAERVAPDAEWLSEVGIDDMGRVVLVYGTRREQVMASAPTPPACPARARGVPRLSSRATASTPADLSPWTAPVVRSTCGGTSRP
jgi:hypothetical protein